MKLKSFLSAMLLLCVSVYMMGAQTVTTVEQVGTGTKTTGSNVDYVITSTTPFKNSSSYVSINSKTSVVIIQNVKPSVFLSMSNGFSQIKISGTTAVNGTNCQVRMYNKGTIILPYAEGDGTAILTTYTGTNQSGTSYTNYSTGHSGGFMKTLTDADGLNNIKSFTLKRGYMVTFATGTAGWGYSRCFIAAYEDLTMNLPTVLAGNVSSYRVFPFFNFSKSSVGDNTDVTAHRALNSTGGYTWGMGQDMGPDVECVVNHIYEDWPSASACGSQNYTPHMKTNNEPRNSSDDHPQDLETILGNWQNLMRTGMRLGSPTSWDGSDYWNGTGFIKGFLDEIDARGWRCDFVDAHCYWNEYNFTYLESMWWPNMHRPIWVSEWVWGASWNSNGCFASGQTESTIVSTTSNILSTLNNSAHVERYFYWNSEADISKIYKSGALTTLGQTYAATDGGLGYNASYEFVPTVVINRPYDLTGSINGSNVSLNWYSPNGDMCNTVKIQYKTANATTWNTLATQHPADKTSKNDVQNTFSGTLANAGNYIWRVVETYESTEYASDVFSTTVAQNDDLNYLPSNLGDYYFQFYSKEANTDLCWAVAESGNDRVQYKAANSTDKYQLWCIENNSANGGYSFRNLGEPGYLINTNSDAPWNFVTRNSDYTIASAETAFLPIYYSDGYWVVKNIVANMYVGLWDNDKSFAAGEVLAANRTNPTGNTDSADRIGIRAIPRADLNSTLGISAGETPSVGTSYYIYNADAGKFLVNGNSYGTRASLGASGLLWTMQQHPTTGLYTFLNNSNSKYLFVTEADGMYVDGADSNGATIGSVDVTSTYLTNANFANATAATANVGTANNTTATSVTGWTGVASGWHGSAVFSYGSSYYLQATGIGTPPTADPNGNTSGKCLGIVAAWANGTTYYYQSVTLPAGDYTLTIPVYNAGGTNNGTSYIGWVPDSGTSSVTSTTATTVGSWVTQTINFSLAAATTGKICLGYVVTTDAGSASNPHLFFSGVTLTKNDYTPTNDGNQRYFQLNQDSDGYYTIQVNPNSTNFGTAAMGTRYVGFVGDLAGTPYVLPCPLESYHSGVGNKWLFMNETAYNLYKNAINGASSYRQEMWAYVRAAKAKGIGNEEIAIYENPESTVADIMTAQNSLKAKLLALEATENAPVDYSFLLGNADCGSTTFEGWNADGDWSSNTTFYHNGDALLTNRFYEIWVGSGSQLGNRTLSQSVTDLPAGKYQLALDIVATQQGNANLTVTGVNLFLGDQSVSCATANGVPQCFTTPTFEVSNGATVTMGLEISSTTANWVAFDNFRLLYLGPTNNEVVGDITGDGNLTTADVIALVNYLLGRSNNGVVNEDATDVDGNGVKNLADLTKLIHILLGK